MERRRLGRTNLTVSALCLGSMTWGSQNTEAEGCAQIDQALAAGCDFIDTAEMYPVTPRRAETTGDTEAIIGAWVESRRARDKIVIATKVVGAGYAMIRDGGPIAPTAIRAAIEGSLRRLKTDYVDLYQLHWPNRGSYHFRQSWRYDPSGQPDREAIRDDIRSCLEALGDLVAEGKVRHVGLSNETAWGVCQFLDVAERHALPRVASVQNEYGPMCRLYDTDLAEVTRHEDVGLLAFTPLAGGMLSGKYAGGARPAGSRATIMEGIGGRMTPRGLAAADAYVALARRHGLDPVGMTLAWCLRRPFMTSVIFGATTPEQLASCLAGAELKLSDEVMDGIDEIHRAHPMPY